MWFLTWESIKVLVKPDWGFRKYQHWLYNVTRTPVVADDVGGPNSCLLLLMLPVEPSCFDFALSHGAALTSGMLANLMHAEA